MKRHRYRPSRVARRHNWQQARDAEMRRSQPREWTPLDAWIGVVEREFADALNAFAAVLRGAIGDYWRQGVATLAALPFDEPTKQA